MHMAIRSEYVGGGEEAMLDIVDVRGRWAFELLISCRGLGGWGEGGNPGQQRIQPALHSRTVTRV